MVVFGGLPFSFFSERAGKICFCLLIITHAIGQLSIRELLKVSSTSQHEGLNRTRMEKQRKTATPLSLHGTVASIFGIKVCCSHS